MSGFSPTRSSKNSPARSRSRLTALALLTAAASVIAHAEVLSPVPSRDRKVIRRWALSGEPRGVALGPGGTIYVGLAQPQAVVAINRGSGEVKKRIVLDSAEIASTKELVTMRTNPDRTRLFIANGSDESATILSLPDLAVLREITMEGETIRDAVPDPGGRYVYLLGRRVHVYDGNGNVELRTLPVEDPMAIAASANGAMLAVVATEDFGNAKATSVALFDTKTFAEIAREPLQTTQTIESLTFADDDRAIVALSREYLFEKSVMSRPARAMTAEGTNGTMRMTLDFGDLTNSDRICLPEGSGPQIAVLGAADTLLLYAERRCSASGSFTGSHRRVLPASLYGVSAYAVAYDRETNALVVSDRAGFLTLYSVPRVTLAR